MRYVAAYLLASLGSNSSPSAADVEKILSSVGIEAESDKVKQVVTQLKGKDLEELIAEGSKKLASMPTGGAVAAAGSGAAAGGGGSGGGAAAPAEAKKEEKKEESEESDDDMGFGLFD